MTSNDTRATMTNTTTTTLLLLLSGCIALAGCGPEFDPGSLVDKTRVLGARIEVDGAPDRAAPMPGETANLSWLVAAPGITPPLAWAFAACLPGPAGATTSPVCAGAPLALFDGTASPPRLSLPVPSAAALGGAPSIVIVGQICDGAGSVPRFAPQGGQLPSCTGTRGTTVSLEVPLQLGPDVNHNPTADRAFTFDGNAWPAPAPGDDPCVLGPRVAAGSKDHVIGNTTDGADRERYTVLAGDPPVATPARERLQISQFTTAGKLKSQFAFVESADESAATTVDVTWEAPEPADVAPAGTPVTFTFVVRDERGGTDWTTRQLCVTP